MNRVGKLSLDEALQMATRKIMPAGLKPEDYLIIGEQIPMRLATMIVKDALHLMRYGSNDC